ncbi:hypothetical protein SLEP1_g7651 [Rubroshorea leprosula]|uniref:Uncharacterized protein n=1 Tax=Rubroshorea leprosula TaxID=152421 RepID=A0AAV5I882_9ROSI|nr:hypothetical protein SLEP1_g7651 [Rubroshorea leprosula]
MPDFNESCHHARLMADIGDMMNVEVSEGSTDSSNPYFSSPWRQSFNGYTSLFFAGRFLFRYGSSLDCRDKDGNLSIPIPNGDKLVCVI